MNPLYPSDAQAKAEILDAGRKIYQRGLVAANDGNLSVRVGGQRPVGYAHRRFKRRHDGGYAGQALSGRHGIGGDSEALFGDKNALAHLPGEPRRPRCGACPPACRHRVRRSGPSPGPPCPPGGCGAAGHRACGPLCPARVPRRWRTASPPTARRTGPCCWNTTARSPGEPPWSRPTTVWNVWNSWPPSPSTCGLWAFIARCRSLWLRRWRGCDPPGASSDPAAVLLPSERVSPFRPLIGGNSTQLIPNFS